MARHTHKFTIADDEAVRALIDKLVCGGPQGVRREKLLHALDDAARHYKDSKQEVRRAFFRRTPDRLCRSAEVVVVRILASAESGALKVAPTEIRFPKFSPLDS